MTEPHRPRTSLAEETVRSLLDVLRAGMGPVVVPVSGGIDSTVAATAVRRADRDLISVSFRYGQRHERELRSAMAVSEALGATEHVVLDLALLGQTRSSSLTNGALEMIAGEDEPRTWVPGRNLMFLAHAVALAESRGSRTILFGANADDAAGYPDCRPTFISAVDSAARSGSRDGPAVLAPLLHLRKADVVAAGLVLGAPLHLTWSCYDPRADGSTCDRCDACRLRAEAFSAVGICDPASAAP